MITEQNTTLGPIANCIWCEKGFLQTRPHRRYCSQRCKSAQANRLRKVRLENPGAPPSEIAHQLEELRQAWRQVEIYGEPCVVCGKKFHRRGVHPRRHTCSEECRRERIRQNSRDYYYQHVAGQRVSNRLKRRRKIKEKARVTGVLDRECALCATVFTAEDNTARIYCSTTCLQAATRSKARTRALPEARECVWCGTVFKPYRFTHYTCCLECSYKRRSTRATNLSDSAVIGDSGEYREFCLRLRAEHAKALQEREQKAEARRHARAEKEQARAEKARRRELRRKTREEALAQAKAEALREELEEMELIDYSLMPLPLILRSARKADVGQLAREYLRSPEGRQRLKAAGVRVK